MNSLLVKFFVLLSFLFGSQVLLADKPSWASKGEPSADEKMYHKKDMYNNHSDNEEDDDEEDEYKKSKKKKEHHDDEEDDD